MDDVLVIELASRFRFTHESDEGLVIQLAQKLVSSVREDPDCSDDRDQVLKAMDKFFNHPDAGFKLLDTLHRLHFSFWLDEDLTDAEREFKRHTFKKIGSMVKFHKASLNDDAGILGSAQSILQ